LDEILKLHWSHDNVTVQDEFNFEPTIQ
jgi:hypothetical protein